MSRAPARADVRKTFAAYPKNLRAKLEALRRLILETAAATPGVGAIEETLKWGQPSYLTSKSGSGSTIRIDAMKARSDQYAMFFHCQTDLVATFRELYPNQFAFSGNRRIVFGTADKIDKKALCHCIALALTYHLRKRRGPTQQPAKDTRK